MASTPDSIVSYGNYTFRSSPIVSIQRPRGEGTPAANAQTIREQWTLHAQITGSDPDDMNAEIARMEAAFLQDGQDLKWQLANGTVVRNVPNSSTLTGIRVTQQPSYTETDPRTEWIAYRSANISLEYEIPIQATIPIAGGSITFTRSMASGEDGQNILTIAGKARGPARVQAVSQLAIPLLATGQSVVDWWLLNKRDSDNPYAQELDFQRTFIDPASREIKTWQETLTMRLSYVPYVMRRRINNLRPKKYNLPWEPFTWSQRGSATGRTVAPDPPTTIFPWPMEPEITRNSGKLLIDNLTITDLSTSWSWRGELEFDPLNVMTIAATPQPLP